MDIPVKIKKEGDIFLASCEEFGLFAEDSDRNKVVERIREAFYFALQSPDFIEEHKKKLNKIFDLELVRPASGNRDSTSCPA